MRDPAIFMVEILWRWSFSILACLLVVGVGLMLLGPLHVGPVWDNAWRSRDPQRMSQVVLGVVLILGVKVIMTAVIAAPLAIALIWSILSALGRFVTVRRLRAGLASLGIDTVVPITQSSVVLRAYRLPRDLSYSTLHDALKADGFVIYAGQGDLSKTLFRVSTMGNLASTDIDRLILEAWDRVWPWLKENPDELQKRLARRHSPTLTRPPRAWSPSP